MDWLEPFRRDTERIRQENVKMREGTEKIRQENEKIREETEKLREQNEKLARIEEDLRIKRLIREVLQELDDNQTL
jgi:hypothetical protein